MIRMYDVIAYNLYDGVLLIASMVVPWAVVWILQTVREYFDPHEATCPVCQKYIHHSEGIVYPGGHHISCDSLGS